jgi:hypothetical protein
MKRNRKMSHSESTARFLGAIVLLGIAAGVAFFYYTSTHSETITVQDKERVCSTSRSCEYLVWTDKGVFKNADETLGLKFDSSDVQGHLRVGGTYQVKVRGYRIPLLSQYPNIVEVENPGVGRPQ